MSMSRSEPIGTEARLCGGGLITPLAGTLEDNWRMLCAGRTLSTHSQIPTDRPIHTGRAVHWAHLAARQAIEQAGWDDSLLADEQTALVVGTSKGPVERWITPKAPSIDPSGLARIAEKIACELGISGPRFTCSAACASGLQALIHAVLLIRSGQAQRVLVVAVESSIHPLFLGSFARLRVLSTAGGGCRPFDQNRDGFLMSEAAAALCLQAFNPHSSPPPGLSAEQFPPVIVDRFALGGDATHLTGTDPAAVTLRHLLKTVLNHQPVDLIHAHGTGTELNDTIELRAIESAIAGLQAGNLLPVFHSHKAAFGHSLGASGLISILINWLCHLNGLIPPNPNTTNPIPMQQVRLSAGVTHQPVRRSLAIATGFGGSCAAATLKSLL